MIRHNWSFIPFLLGHLTASCKLTEPDVVICIISTSAVFFLRLSTFIIYDLFLSYWTLHAVTVVGNLWSRTRASWMIPRSSRCPFLANEVGLDSAGPNWVVVVVVVGLERHRLAVSCPSSSIPLTEWSTGHNSHAGATQQWSINMSRPGQCARASDGKPRPFTAVRSRKSNEKKETNKKNGTRPTWKERGAEN